MRGGVFLDTTFLITLVNRGGDGQIEAEKFYRHFLSHRIPMGVSSIVVAEFCVKQKWTTMPADQFVLENFTHEDAMVAAALDMTPYKPVGQSASPGARQILKDDFKIIGHAASREYSYLLTRDAETMFRYCEDLRKAAQVKVQAIDLAKGFDASPFSPESDPLGELLKTPFSL